MGAPKGGKKQLPSQVYGGKDQPDSGCPQCTRRHLSLSKFSMRVLTLRAFKSRTSQISVLFLATVKIVPLNLLLTSWIMTSLSSDVLFHLF